MTGIFIVQSVYPTWLIQRGLEAGHVAMLYVVAGVFGMLAGLGAGLAAGRFREQRKLLASILAAGATSACFIAALPPTFGAQFVPFAILSASAALLSPVLRASVNDLVAPHERGSLNALWNAFFQFASTIGAIAGTLLLAQNATFGWNGFTATLLLAAAAGMFLFKARG